MSSGLGLPYSISLLYGSTFWEYSKGFRANSNYEFIGIKRIKCYLPRKIHSRCNNAFGDVPRNWSCKSSPSCSFPTPASAMHALYTCYSASNRLVGRWRFGRCPSMLMPMQTLARVHFLLHAATFLSWCCRAPIAFTSWSPRSAECAWALNSPT